MALKLLETTGFYLPMV